MNAYPLQPSHAPSLGENGGSEEDETQDVQAWENHLARLCKGESLIAPFSLPAEITSTRSKCRSTDSGKSAGGGTKPNCDLRVEQLVRG
eukprot:scaffold417890_cov40-Prasinocladus_malaysianus.AAC.4